MAAVHIPESEAARNFAAVMDHIRSGAEVVIEKDAMAVAVVSPPKTPGLMLSEVIARAEARGAAETLGGDFARDLEEAIASHPEPLSSLSPVSI